jgi:hypothetical protein
MDNFPQGIKDFPYVQSNIPEGIEDFPYGQMVNPSVGQVWEVVEKYVSSQNCAGGEDAVNSSVAGYTALHLVCQTFTIY